MTSKKNLAELHMIIDLMRNDLNRICIPGTVEVKDANRLVSFVNVHHLVGSVIGQLREGLTVKDLLTALCPGGSITGAPKIEVMLAIREYEQRPRGYFMGHAFMLDDTGTFNSSILIRTLQKQSGKDYEFSAGSGIVIHSDPKSERLEIDAKCKVLKR
jgi:para-aminobenzoate synthetase component 1